MVGVKIYAAWRRVVRDNDEDDDEENGPLNDSKNQGF